MGDKIFMDISIIVILSFVIPIISTKLFKYIIPSVAIEIIAGFLLGKSGFGLIVENNIMDFVSMFGLVYLMFLAGLEMDIEMVRDLKGAKIIYSPIFLAFFVFFITLIVAYPFSLFIVKQFSYTSDPIYLSFILSTTSVAIVHPLLKSRTDLKKIYKQTVFLSAIVADFTTLFLISIYALFKEEKTSIISFIILFALFAVSLLSGKIIKFFYKHKFSREMFSLLKYHSTVQIGVRAVFALLFIFLFLAELFGIEVILGAFLAGAIVSYISGKETNILRMKLDAIGYGFFIPFFFIYQGANSSFPNISYENIYLIILIILGGLLIKIIASLPLLLRFNFKDTFSAGVLLSSRLSLIIAASTIGLKLGLISEDLNSSIILIAVFSCIISPSVFNIIKKRKFSHHPGRIIVVGGGTVGSGIARRFSSKERSVVIVEKNMEKCRKLSEEKIGEVYCFNAKDDTVWEKIKPRKNDVVLLLTNSDKVNLDIASIIKKYEIDSMFARDNDPQSRGIYKKEGITPLIYSEQLLNIIEMAINYTSVFELFSKDKNLIEERRISRLSGVPIENANFPVLIEIILIKRGKDWIYPRENTVLKKDDVVIFITNKEDSKVVEKIVF